MVPDILKISTKTDCSGGGQSYVGDDDDHGDCNGHHYHDDDDDGDEDPEDENARQENLCGFDFIAVGFENCDQN